MTRSETSHIRAAPSNAAVKSVRPSELKVTVEIDRVYPPSWSSFLPVEVSHTLTRLSELAVASNRPFGLNAAGLNWGKESLIYCPRRITSFPVADSQSDAILPLVVRSHRLSGLKQVVTVA